MDGVIASSGGCGLFRSSTRCYSPSLSQRRLVLNARRRVHERMPYVPTRKVTCLDEPETSQKLCEHRGLVLVMLHMLFQSTCAPKTRLVLTTRGWLYGNRKCTCKKTDWPGPATRYKCRCEVSTCPRYALTQSESQATTCALSPRMDEIGTDEWIGYLPRSTTGRCEIATCDLSPCCLHTVKVREIRVDLKLKPADGWMWLHLW